MGNLSHFEKKKLRPYKNCAILGKSCLPGEFCITWRKFNGEAKFLCQARGQLNMRFPGVFIVFQALARWVGPQGIDQAWKRLEEAEKEAKKKSSVTAKPPAMKRVSERHKEFKKLLATANDKVADLNAEDKVKVRLVDFPKLAEGFRVQDVDIFLDTCCFCEGTAQPLHIAAAHHEETYYDEDKRSAMRERVKEHHWADLLKNGRLEGHRTVLERVVLPKGSSTKGGEHPGHEAILIIQGKVQFSIPGQGTFLLQAGDFFSFNSGHRHSAIEAGGENEKEAIFVVARPTNWAAYGTSSATPLAS